jgi:hypothetical protein
MPTHPISIPLLPPAAQAVIGRVHPETEPALAILRQEGFVATGMVDIFEAGPIVSCRRDDLRLVRQSVWAPVAGIAAAPPDAAARAAFLLMPDISNGCSCLHVASFFGHVTVVLFLLSLSCPGLGDLRDRSGRTALELAVAAGQTTIGATSAGSTATVV